MPKMIALLRGVNVGGHTVKMDRLKALFGEMGCTGVSTHIQSGNVLFDGVHEPTDGLAERLEAGLAAALGFDVPVLLLAADELGGILAANPFADRSLSDGERVYITVLAEAPAPEAASRLTPDPKSADEFMLLGRAAYILCHGGYHETAYSNAFFEKKLKMKATTRNLEVLVKLLELAEAPLES